MIQIDKHNVEAHYLDYLEGNLSAEDTAVLMSFIDVNPEFADLFADTDDILSLQLSPPSEKFGDTSDLKTLPCPDDEICLANIDYWLIAKSENTLSKANEKAVDAFVLENNLEKSEAYIAAAYLKPNLSETFGNTKVLKKEGATIIPFLLRFASIAAVFLFVWLVWNPNQKVETEYAARTGEDDFFKAAEYLSPEVLTNNISDKMIAAGEVTLPKQSQKVRPANDRPKKPTNKSKSFEDFPIFNRSVENIRVPQEIAFINPPQLMQEEQDLNIFISDFEAMIANSATEVNDDLAEVNTNTSKYELQEQYKPVTKRLSNLTSLDMSVRKVPETADISHTVVQIGKFSFERKKKK